MNIYVESLKKIDINYNVESKKIKESLSPDVVTEIISEGVKNGGNWWYEYAYRYEGGTNRFYYRLRPSVGIKDYKINKGDIIRIDHEDSSIIPSYIIAKEDVYIAFRPGKNQNQYSEDFRTGDWYRLGDEDLSGNTYATHNQIKIALCVTDSDGYGKLLIPYDEEKDVIDFSRVNDHEYYYSKTAFVSVNPDDNEALIEPYTFITEGIITDYISFQWKDGYNEPGSFTLVLPATQETMDLLKEDRYLLIGDSIHTMLIETIVFNNNLKSDGYIMQVSGRSIECILERRVAFPGQGLNTNVYKGENGMAKAIYDLVDHFFIHPEEIAMESSDGQKYFYYPERRIPFICIPSEDKRYTDVYMKRNFRASVNKTVSKDDLLKTISSLCKNEQLGFKIEVKRPYEFSVALYWEFSLYTGSDKSYTRLNKNDPLLLFSPTLGNVESVATTRDNTNYRNAIFCGVEKDSDGYIDLTRNGSEANYFNQKTGVDIVDKFNSGATSLITGAKNRLVSMLEASEVCYTGIYFLALAASRKDKDYTATVTKIENAYNYEAKSIVYVKVDSYEKILQRINESDIYINMIYDKMPSGAYSPSNEGYNGTPTKLKIDKDDIVTLNSIKYYKVTIENYGNTYTSKKDKPYAGFCAFSRYAQANAYDILYEFYNATDRAPKGLLYPTNFEDAFIGIPGSEETPITNKLMICDFSGNPIEWDTDNWGSGNNDDTKIKWRHGDGPDCLALPYECYYVTDYSNDSVSVSSYPNKYVSRAEAELITITYRQAFGDVDESSSNKTATFRLSVVNETLANPLPNNPDKKEMDFKTSTQVGWLTTPILKQAINDLNNINFEKLDIFKKSALQAWFKTLDKYTSTNSQKRWLCQEYRYDVDNEGLNRREVFVEEDNTESDEWNVSAINQWQSNTQTISVNQEEDEESDEQVNERLMESARKRSGGYRKVKNVDATFEHNYYEYMGHDQNGYDLGDIIQVDDGWGNLDKFYISSVTFSNDTTSGLKKVPTFERYEDIPKEYKRLDYLQVANMILPAKFNRKFSGEENARGVSLKSNYYFGSRRTDGGEDNPKLDNIKNIYSETIGVITDIECELQYVQKEVTSGEPEPLSPVFALISAIGSQERSRKTDPDTGKLTSYYGVNLPFALVSTKYVSPFFFMTQHDNSFVGNTRRIFTYIGNRVLYDENTPRNSYYITGVGIRNVFHHIDFGENYKIRTPYSDNDNNIFCGGIEFLDGEYTKINNEQSLMDRIYCFLDNSEKQEYSINRIYEETPEFMTYRPSSTIETEIFSKYPFILICHNGELYDSLATNDFDDYYGTTICNYDLQDLVAYVFYKPSGYYEKKKLYYIIDGNKHYETNRNASGNKYRVIIYFGKLVVEFDAGSSTSNYDIYIEEDLENPNNDKKINSFYTDNTTGTHYRGNVIENSETKEIIFPSGGYTIYEGSITSPKDIYYSSMLYDKKKTYSCITKMNDKEIHKNYLSNGIYTDDIRFFSASGQYINNINKPSFISPFNALMNFSDYSYKYILDTGIFMGYSNDDNIITHILDDGFKPIIASIRRPIRKNNTLYGQDNYRLPQYYSDSKTGDDYNIEYNDLLYENHIVIGGCGIYVFDDSVSDDYILKFYKYDDIESEDPQTHKTINPLSNISPKACDTNNGVRIYGSMKIYETLCSTRQITLEDNDIFYYNNDKVTGGNTIYSKPNTVVEGYSGQDDINAYYPDLSTRKLVHEYIPVHYVEGGNDILKEEEYGLYDLVDRIFVPINWGGNSAATFIQAGGEINNE